MIRLRKNLSPAFTDPSQVVSHADIVQININTNLLYFNLSLPKHNSVLELTRQIHAAAAIGGSSSLNLHITVV